MRLPFELQRALERLLQDSGDLAPDAREISERYRNPSGGARSARSTLSAQGVRAVSTESQALAYAAARMPATYGAVSTVLAHAAGASGFAPRSLLDVGAGPGTAAWAACEAFPSIREAALLEPEPAMRAAGQALIREAESSPEALREARWIGGDVLDEALPRADLVIASYMVNELPEDRRVPVARRLFEASSRMLLLIEPGTPDGVRRLLAIRDALLAQGAYVTAPCPHDGPCPLPEGDWCHFAVRVERSRLHKRLKGGDAPFEDEKYAYMVFAHEPPPMPQHPRILRHPIIRPGNVTLSLCSPQGLSSRIVTRADQTAYKAARKSGAGDTWNHP